MNAKISVFVIYVEVTIYLLLHSLHELYRVFHTNIIAFCQQIRYVRLVIYILTYSP